MPLRVRLTGEGLRLTGDPAGLSGPLVVGPPGGGAAFLLATEDGEPLADDAGDHLARDPDDAG